MKIIKICQIPGIFVPYLKFIPFGKILLDLNSRRQELEN